MAVDCRRLPGGEEQICVRIMGVIQLEVLKRLIQDRFGVEVEFAPPQVLYQETVAAPVAGYGHYEPLRHYAEVNLLLEPGPRGSGITFESRCHVDVLSVNYQNLVRTHVFERTHRGILTGSPLTDVRVVLTNGRSHLKHTEGGDFREATYRAIRQGLEKAENLLLEPWYRFEISAPGGIPGPDSLGYPKTVRTGPAAGAVWGRGDCPGLRSGGFLYGLQRGAGLGHPRQRVHFRRQRGL